MLIAYIDESGHSRDPKSHFAGMGGLIADSADWERFTSDWSSALADAGIHDGELHMRHFAHSRGPFQGWTELKRRELMARLIDAIVNAKAIPVGCVVSLDDYNAAPELLQKFYKEPYFMAFQHVTRGASLQALPKEWPPKLETVSMVYAEQREFGATKPRDSKPNLKKGAANELWSAMKKLTVYGQWMGRFSTDSPKSCLPLQAADLFAYELVKEFQNILTKPENGMRWALKQILRLGGPKPLVQFYDAHEMIRIFLEATGQDHHASSVVNGLLTESWLRKIAIGDVLRARLNEVK
ncbi:DUF3800 domain-containing protein [Tunturibacter psychrotolerans]|uniref:DUF3800 domain-containing protein n=1 Tax=Tunturiibacter psychrotolerans TaxID=3069686 RepID=A0AAU7ZKR1_9BACT